jgi:hypothetical protein
MNSTVSETLWLQLLNADFLPLSGKTVHRLESGLSEPGLKFARIIPVINSDAALAAMLLKRAAPQAPASGFEGLEAVARLGKKGIRAVVATAPSVEFLTPQMQMLYQRILLRSAFAQRQTMSLQSFHASDADSASCVAALLSCLAELHVVGVRHAHFDALRAEASARNKSPLVIAERLFGAPLAQLNARIHQMHFGDASLANALLNEKTPGHLLPLRQGYQLARDLGKGIASRDFASAIYTTARVLGTDNDTVFNQARTILMGLLAEGHVPDRKLAEDFRRADIRALREHLELLRKLENDHGEYPPRTEPSSQPAVMRSSQQGVQPEPDDDDGSISVLHEQALGGIAREIGNELDINRILRTITDAAFETLGFARVTLAICNPQRSVVKSRFQLGKDSASWSRNFSFTIQKPDDNVIAWCMNLRKPMRVRIDSFEPRELINDRFRMIVNHVPECVIGPLFSEGKPVAVIYADLGTRSTTRIGAEQYKAFARLIEAANSRLEKSLTKK